MWSVSNGLGLDWSETRRRDKRFNDIVTEQVTLSLGKTSQLIKRQLGAVAQLGEHLVCNQGVVGSNPIRSMFRPGCHAGRNRPQLPT